MPPDAPPEMPVVDVAPSDIRTRPRGTGRRATGQTRPPSGSRRARHSSPRTPSNTSLSATSATIAYMKG
jgi:hypothetical protein